MNETATTKKTEFVFRRLADSFDQFAGDLWGAVPLWLLAVVVVLVAARVVYRSQKLKFDQTPFYTGLAHAGHEGGDFLLIPNAVR